MNEPRFFDLFMGEFFPGPCLSPLPSSEPTSSAMSFRRRTVSGSTSSLVARMGQALGRPGRTCSLLFLLAAQSPRHLPDTLTRFQAARGVSVAAAAVAGDERGVNAALAGARSSVWGSVSLALSTAGWLVPRAVDRDALALIRASRLKIAMWLQSLRLADWVPRGGHLRLDVGG